MMILTIFSSLVFWGLLYALNEWEHKDKAPEERWNHFMKTGW